MGKLLAAPAPNRERSGRRQGHFVDFGLAPDIAAFEQAGADAGWISARS
jgi:hypothetical protein